MPPPPQENVSTALPRLAGGVNRPRCNRTVEGGEARHRSTERLRRNSLTKAPTPAPNIRVSAFSLRL
jgi:hypothetical protein